MAIASPRASRREPPMMYSLFSNSGYFSKMSSILSVIYDCKYGAGFSGNLADAIKDLSILALNYTMEMKHNLFTEVKCSNFFVAFKIFIFKEYLLISQN